MFLLYLFVLLSYLHLGSFQSRSDCLLILKLQRHFLHLASKLHEVSMRGDVSLLFLFITVNPDLTSVLFCGDLLTLLHNLVKKLFTLDIVLLFESFLCYFKLICFSLAISQFLLLVLKLTSIVHHH